MDVLSDASRSTQLSHAFGRLRTMALAACLAMAFPPMNLRAEIDADPATVARRIQLEPVLTAELQRVVNAQKRIEGQGKDVTVKARFETLTGGGVDLVIDLSESYVPGVFGSEMEDLQRELHTTAAELLRDIVSFRGVTFRYGGKHVHHYFPEQRLQEMRAAEGRKNAAKRASVPMVVVAAGHGIYYNHGFKDWRAHRDPSNGITEDFITPGYASELLTWLNARSDVVTSSPRSVATLTHGPSGRPWWQVGARYELEANYPDNKEIWNALPTATNSLRERDEDLLSRPLYANHIGASTLIHLHTNAATPSATGTRVFYQKDRTADKPLADSILCYMKELIQAQEPYRDYLVVSEPGQDNFGETRVAKMPSVIVESGFHTNASDALALQDPVFRTAAMKGVEKGYRLHGEGKGCEPLMVSETPDAGGPFGTFVPMEVYYEGHPQFPVTVKVDIASCPIDSTCNGGSVVFSEKVASPLRYAFECRGTSNTPATARLRTTLIDVDEVKAVSTEHELTCTPARRSAPDLAPVDTSRPSLTVGAS
jgi:N-acetylmuramoyl-L-alanine amidase